MALKSRLNFFSCHKTNGLAFLETMSCNLYSFTAINPLVVFEYGTF